MAGDECLTIKMKRKEIDRVNDDFSDFSLASPARKIRRLDVDLPPIMEEEEAEMAMTKPVADELIPEPVNDERAIVVFKPLQAQHSYHGNLYVDSDLISGFKYKFLQAGYSEDIRQNDEDYEEYQTSNNCRAVVPWNPSQFATAQSTEPFQESHAPEIIQLDETGEDAMMEEASMEVEEDGYSSSTPLPQEPQQFTHGFGAARGSEGLPHWQQQPHCMIPQPPQTNSTPISWSR